MPAVDPARLAGEIDAVFGRAHEPAALARQVLELLERYAERARRHGGQREDALDSPRPVTAALAHAVEAEASRTGAGLDLAEALWSIPVRETRLLASEALGVENGEGVADWAESRAAATADLRVLEAMAGRGLAAWGSRDRAAALRRVGRWVGEGNARVRELGLLFLLPIVERGGSEDLRRVINLLGVCTEVGKGPERRTLSRLFLALIRRSPQEAARFLMDAVGQGNLVVSQIARQTLPVLPAKQKQVVEEALARGRASGIIPPSQ